MCHYRNPLWHKSHLFENGLIVFPVPENIPLAAITAPLDALYCFKGLKERFTYGSMCHYRNQLWHNVTSF